MLTEPVQYTFVRVGRRKPVNIFRGVATGGISVYIPPKSVYLTNFYVVTGCFFFDPGRIVVDFEIGMTS